jgi:CheY-like chemotaxis protein
VLLLDDDPGFRESIRDFLAANGYTVVAVQNGAEGVREVLGGDFVLVLCNLIIPGLGGDTFYRAIGRIRPALCQRFVFMTGHENDAAAMEFVTKVDAVVLQKPFPLTKLLASIAVAEARTTFQSVYDHTAAGPDLSQGSEAVNCFRAVGLSPSQSSAILRILARAGNDRPLTEPSEALSDGEPQLRAGGIFRTSVLAVLAILLSLAGGLWLGYLNARDRSEAATAKRRALESEWAEISPDLQEALATRAKAAEAANQLVRLTAERTKPRWTPALHGLVPPGDERIDIMEVSARGETRDLGACEVRVRGMAGGTVPEVTAERFRQSVEDALKSNVNGRPVSVRLEPCEKMAGALRDESRADFVVIATTGSLEPAVTMKKEGR